MKSNSLGSYKEFAVLLKVASSGKGKSKKYPSATVVAFWAVLPPEGEKKIIIVTLSEMIRRT